MASKRIYVTLMVDINNDNLNAELCDWTEGD